MFFTMLLGNNWFIVIGDFQPETNLLVDADYLLSALTIIVLCYKIYSWARYFQKKCTTAHISYVYTLQYDTCEFWRCFTRNSSTKSFYFFFCWIFSKLSCRLEPWQPGGRMLKVQKWNPISYVVEMLETHVSYGERIFGCEPFMCMQLS